MKKGQIDYPILTFIVVIIGLLFIAPLVYKVVNTSLDNFANSINNVTEGAGDNVRFVETRFANTWDVIIIIAFIINVLLLFISAFLIDTHPVFIVLYLVFSIFTMMFAPTILDSVDAIYDSATFVNETANLPFMDFVRNYFGVIILGIMILTGIIIYAKFKYSQPLR